MEIEFYIQTEGKKFHFTMISMKKKYGWFVYFQRLYLPKKWKLYWVSAYRKQTIQNVWARFPYVECILLPYFFVHLQFIRIFFSFSKTLSSLDWLKCELGHTTYAYEKNIENSIRSNSNGSVCIGKTVSNRYNCFVAVEIYVFCVSVSVSVCLFECVYVCVSGVVSICINFSISSWPIIIHMSTKTTC